MSPFGPCIIFSVAIAMLSWGVASPSPFVTFDELQQMNASCPKLDTCQRKDPSNDNLLNVNCQCGPSCVRFGTCCLDAPSMKSGAKSVDYGGGLKCLLPYGNTAAVFMVDKCPTDWEGDDSVRDLCVGNGEEQSDLMMLVPVSSLKTGVTYRNNFCFICNNIDDSDDSIITWDISILFSNRSHARDVDLSTLTFDIQTYQWTYPDASLNSILQLNTVPPSKLLEKHTIFCRQHVVSACAQNWTEPQTRSKCESYTALVSMRDDDFVSNTYRNVHCGTCNWGRGDTVRCTDYLDAHPLAAGAKRPTVSAAKVFQELFRISEDPEDQCQVGQIYDRIVKRCRNVRCGRKMEMVKGRCVRKQ